MGTKARDQAGRALWAEWMGGLAGGCGSADVAWAHGHDAAAGHPVGGAWRRGRARACPAQVLGFMPAMEGPPDWGVLFVWDGTDALPLPYW